MVYAIETRYKGSRFRSRLEARWAVFFDTLGVVWEYEREGFELEGVGRYLPDFWLPHLEAWFEVKGARMNDKDYSKVRALADSHRPVIVAAGDIGAETLTLFALDETDSSGGSYECEGTWLLNHQGSLLFGVYDKRVPAGRTVLDSDWNELNWVEGVQTHSMMPAPLRDAYFAGRGARFEFGRRGR